MKAFRNDLHRYYRVKSKFNVRVTNIIFHSTRSQSGVKQ